MMEALATVPPPPGTKRKTFTDVDLSEIRAGITVEQQMTLWSHPEVRVLAEQMSYYEVVQDFSRRIYGQRCLADVVNRHSQSGMVTYSRAVALALIHVFASITDLRTAVLIISTDPETVFVSVREYLQTFLQNTWSAQKYDFQLTLLVNSISALALTMFPSTPTKGLITLLSAANLDEATNSAVMLHSYNRIQELSVTIQ